MIATKVGQKPGRTGLSATNVRLALDESLGRLRTDRVDIFYAHIDDQTVPLEETLGALSELVHAGKARYLGASNYSATRLQEALAISERMGCPASRSSSPSTTCCTATTKPSWRTCAPNKGSAAFHTSVWRRGS